MSRETDTVYQVTRIKANEVNLLDNKVIDQLMESKTEDAMKRILKDHGYNVDDDNTDILTNEEEKMWQFINELGIDMKDFSTLIVERDFHNLKVEIKSAYTDTEVSDLYQKYGLIDIKTIQDAVKEKDFSILPEYIQEYAREAFDILFKTGDGQIADSIIDKGALSAMHYFSKKSDLQILKEYASLKTAIANIKIAIRGTRTNKDRAFFERFMQETDLLNVSSLIKASIIGEDEIYSYLEITDFKDGIDLIKTDFASFERWCDNKLIETIKKEKYNSFTLSPVVAYIIAKQMEIKNVGILLIAKRNEFSNEEISKRMRDMYV